MRAVPKKFGRLDVALNVAGVLGKTGAIHELSMADYDFVSPDLTLSGEMIYHSFRS